MFHILKIFEVLIPRLFLDHEDLIIWHAWLWRMIFSACSTDPLSGSSSLSLLLENKFDAPTVIWIMDYLTNWPQFVRHQNFVLKVTAGRTGNRPGILPVRLPEWHHFVPPAEVFCRILHCRVSPHWKQVGVQDVGGDIVVQEQRKWEWIVQPEKDLILFDLLQLEMENDLHALSTIRTMHSDFTRDISCLLNWGNLMPLQSPVWQTLSPLDSAFLRHQNWTSEVLEAANGTLHLLAASTISYVRAQKVGGGLEVQGKFINRKNRTGSGLLVHYWACWWPCYSATASTPFFLSERGINLMPLQSPGLQTMWPYATFYEAPEMCASRRQIPQTGPGRTFRGLDQANCNQLWYFL